MPVFCWETETPDARPFPFHRDEVGLASPNEVSWFSFSEEGCVGSSALRVIAKLPKPERLRGREGFNAPGS